MHLNVILPSSGGGTRLFSSQPKVGSYLIDGEQVFEKQIKAIDQVYPQAEIIYITGYRADKIDTSIKKLEANIIHNWKYDTTNVAYSINLAVSKVYDGGVLIILGDLYFDSKFLKKMPVLGKESFLIIDKSENIGEKEIGINVENGEWDYEFKQKWGQICYLAPNDVNAFHELSDKPSARNKFCFEILGEMSMKGVNFNYIGISGCLFEIDKQKDIQKINEHIYKERC